MPSSLGRRDLFFSPLIDGQDSCGQLLIDAHCMELPADWAERYREPLRRAHAALAAIEAGAIANGDEQRMVGHYWLRDPSLAPTAEIRTAIASTVAQIHAFAAAVHSGAATGGSGQRFANLLVIGIGGSALGPQLAAAALGGQADRLRPFFFDNTDPDGMERTLATIGRTPAGLAGTLVIVISKSGGTKETRNGMLHAQAAFGRAGVDFAMHAVAVTGAGSELDRVAAGWRARFPMWDFVGGRTSELSAVGLLPAALQGLDIDGILRGGRAMDALTRRAEPSENPAMLLAVCWHQATAGRGQKDMVVLPYKDRFELFSRYLQQLVMESLGKELDRSGQRVDQGISVYGNKGSTDQHAYVQQLRDGVNNFFVTFIESLRDHQEPTATQLYVEEGVTSGDYLLGFMLGTQRALADKGRHSLTITVADCSPATLGALIALYERTVGIYAELIDINAYHQPGVEAGKRAAATVLRLQQQLVGALSATPQSAGELVAKSAADADPFTAWKILEHLAANGRLQRQLGDGGSPFDARYWR